MENQKILSCRFIAQACQCEMAQKITHRKLGTLNSFGFGDLRCYLIRNVKKSVFVWVPPCFWVSQTPERCISCGPSQPGFLLIDFAVATGIKFCNLTGLGECGKAVYRLHSYTHICTVRATVSRFSIFSCVQKEMLRYQLAEVCASELTRVASLLCF